MTPCNGIAKGFGLLGLMCLGHIIPLNGQSTILEEDFETDGNGIRYQVSNEFYLKEDSYFGRIHGPTEEYNFPGSNNHIQITGDGPPELQLGAYTGFNGNYYVAGEDQDNFPGDGIDEKRVTFEVDISAASGITFFGLFAAGNTHTCGNNEYDSDDYIRVSYIIDGGPEQEGLCFSSSSLCTALNAPHD